MRNVCQIILLYNLKGNFKSRRTLLLSPVYYEYLQHSHCIIIYGYSVIFMLQIHVLYVKRWLL